MLATAKSYRENVLAILNSQMPIERKKTIIENLLEQIALINNGDSGNILKNIKELTEDEKKILKNIYSEVKEVLDNLGQESRS